MQPTDLRLLPWPAAAAGLDAPARLRHLAAGALRTGRPLAIWREPGAVQPHLLVARSLEATYTGLPPALDAAAPAGFAFFPFRDSDHNPALFLPADVQYDLAQPEAVRIAPAARGLVPNIAAWLTLPTPPTLDWHHSAQPAPPPTTQADYTALVRTGVAAIEAKEVVKVVSSRVAHRPLPAEFDPLVAFQELSRKYERAFVSLVSVPGVGTWLGASPEVLAEVTADGHFHTMALAGTQPLVPGHRPQDAIWRQKEIEEQALVARYIVSCFKQLRLREYQETGPRTVTAGQLLHLRTDFEVNLQNVPFASSLGTDMLRLLHPTSAVGGMPKVAALEFLRRHERYDRAYYSGFLGPVNVAAPGVSRLFVNLRCLQVRPTEAILYAGTGLTVDSDPAREWQETEMKLQTVAAVLG
ncbi:isochorismate synthase [Hymenobacter sp. UV11]|uniref:chorismate-binding protein n=1 Tax=Hymenobacter sp. UV11 TaxID=1849735 RepID=UPI001060925F|nr:chorismate-binding protein [Hymenobacter sp. UV11]TDN38108.1 chorismate-binding protein [Hymenobacter sp. UV11]TFZ63153.1 isochorismate synthase [Hymenobacter sp. UV11]